MCSRRISRRGPPSSRPIEMEGWWSGWWGVLAGISGSVRGRDVWKDGVLGLLILACGDCVVCEKLVGRKKIHPPLSSSTPHSIQHAALVLSLRTSRHTQSLRSHPRPTPCSSPQNPADSGGSPTADCLQIGHVRFALSHVPMHSGWNSCLQCRTIRRSPPTNSQQQIQQRES